MIVKCLSVRQPWAWAIIIGITVPSAARTHGALIGHVELTGIENEYTCLSEWFMGPFGFVLQDPVPLPEPIPCRGTLNIFHCVVDADAKELY